MKNLAPAKKAKKTADKAKTVQAPKSSTTWKMSVKDFKNNGCLINGD